ncbi:MAG: DUF2779 domain-containing protein [Bdellovibrionota bacterium]
MGLSKTRLMRGIQCAKALYFTVYRRELEAKPGPEQQAVFDQGNQVGALARERFPGGVLIDVPHYRPEEALAQTAAAIENGAEVLFEAAFEAQGVLVRVDVLRKQSSGWELIEVKSSTQVKDEHLQDLAIQAWVLAAAGLRVNTMSVMVLNRECRYPDLSNLFVSFDRTAEVHALSESTEKVIRTLQKMIAGKQEPDVAIGAHCDSPYECAFKSHCWKGAPEISVLNIPGLRNRWELFESGTVALSPEIPGLSPQQLKMVRSTLSGERVVDAAQIAQALSKWEAPFSYLDFETIAPAVPRYDGVGPYQQTVFQFSLDIEGEGGGLTHHEYLHADPSDPRPKVIAELIRTVPAQGSVIAYYSQFEEARLRELADFADHRGDSASAASLRGIADRLVDPLPVIRAHVYDPAFEGSFSIKAVAPALLGIGYDGMEVGNGSQAQLAFEELISPRITPARKAALTRAMLEYCGQDTMAMVKLVQWMRETFKGPKTSP